MPDADRPRTPRLQRREVLALGVGAFLVASMPRALAARRRAVRRQAPLMGTLADVVAVHEDRSAAHAAIDAALAALHETDRLMSRFRPDSDIGRVNGRARDEHVRVDAQTAHVLAQALHWARTSDGRFDPCLGRASALWDVTRRRTPPRSGLVGLYARRGLWQALDLDLDGDGGLVRLRDSDASLDLGGIAKGHGVDRAVAALRAHGVQHGFVNVGGDLYALGHRADGAAWRVGVRDPQDPSRVTRTLRVSDRAIATSGDYQRYFDHAGTRYHHLLDPATAAPRAAPVHSVTVDAPTCLEADARATAEFGA